MRNRAVDTVFLRVDRGLTKCFGRVHRWRRATKSDNCKIRRTAAMPGGLPGSAEVDGGSFVLFAVMRGQARGGTMSFAEYDALLARTTAPAFDEVGKLTKGSCGAFGRSVSP